MAIKHDHGQVHRWNIGQCHCPHCGHPSKWGIPVTEGTPEKVECPFCGLFLEGKLVRKERGERSSPHQE